jgi:hypothetical protein
MFDTCSYSASLLFLLYTFLTPMTSLVYELYCKGTEAVNCYKLVELETSSSIGATAHCGL